MGKERFRENIRKVRSRLRLAEEVITAMGWPPEAKEDVFTGMNDADSIKPKSKHPSGLPESTFKNDFSPN